MDRVLEKKKGWALIFSKKAIPFAAGIALLAFVGYLLLRNRQTTLRVSAETISVHAVRLGQFNDYVRVSGQVQPMTTVQLTPLEGGVVQHIYIEEGARVQAGDPILSLSNETLDMQILNSEADLAEKENILRNTMISMQQQRLSVEQECLQLSTEVKRCRRAYLSQQSLYNDRLIAREDYLRAKEDYELAAGRLKLVRERAVQDSLYRSVEVRQMRESLDNMRLNMQMIRRRKDNLVIKAPISGSLGTLDVVLGQSLSAGTKIGQVSQLGSFKIQALFDEHYIDRVVPHLEARFERQDDSYSAVIRKVYPEVRDGKFKADFNFKGALPPNVRTGQTYYLNLQLGQPEQALLIPRGTFYQKTGGKWIYVVTPDGTQAFKRQIRIGRQNPKYYEVLEGLEPGEKVITSNYDNFGDNERLLLK